MATPASILTRIPLPHPPLWGSVDGSFAYYTIKDRMPALLTMAIDDLSKARSIEDSSTEKVCD